MFLKRYYLTECVTLRFRIIACAAAQGIPDPETWVYLNRWALAATSGWDEKFDLAGWQTHVDDPLFDPSAAITDEDITAAVLTVRGANENSG